MQQPLYCSSNGLFRKVPVAVPFVVFLNVDVLVYSNSWEERSRDCAVVRALASRRCGLGSNPGQSVISGSKTLSGLRLLLVYVRRHMIQKELDHNIKSGRNLIVNFVSTYFAKEYRYTNLLSQEENLDNS